MAVDVLTRLRHENPVAELPALAAEALFAQIVSGPRDENPARAPRRPSRRRVALVLLVALAVAAPLAFAARSTHVLDFVFGDPPPNAVRQMFERMLEPKYPANEGAPQSVTREDLIRSSERMVAQITTRSGATARLYAADLRTGGMCFVAHGGPFDGSGGCWTMRNNQRYPLNVTSGSLGPRPPGTVGSNITLFGRASSPLAASLVVYYKDGQSQVVPLAHTWFLYEVPKAHLVRGHEPTRIDVLGASGQVIATQDDPFSFNPPPMGKAEKPLAPHRVLARQSLHWKGNVLELQSARGDLGNRCVRVLNARNVVQTHNWMCGPAVGNTTPSINEPRKPVYFEFHQFTSRGKPGGYIYARGWVGPGIASLELRFQDSTVQRIPLHERLFLYVVPADRWVLGKRASYVIGRAESGRIVYRRFLYPRARCFYPVADKRCAGIIVQNG